MINLTSSEIEHIEHDEIDSLEQRATLTATGI